MPKRVVKKNKQEEELEKTHSNADKFLKITYEGVRYFFIITYKTTKFIFKISGIYLLWIFLHYMASHLYVRLCVPSTLFGFIMSPFMTATPHCQGLRWIVYNAANMITNMWIVCGTWVCTTILKVNTHTPNDLSS